MKSLAQENTQSVQSSIAAESERATGNKTRAEAGDEEAMLHRAKVLQIMLRIFSLNQSVIGSKGKVFLGSQRMISGVFPPI